MIRFESISKRYGSTPALEKVSFQLEQGERLALRGPSGSGKTTLLRLVAGLELPDEGRVLLDGNVVSTLSNGSAPYQRGVGMVFQQAALWPHLTVMGNIRYPLLGRPSFEIRTRLQELLEQTGLAELSDRYPGQLSGGEQRTVALARALAARPKLLLFDEPLTSLDASWKDRLLSLILDNVHQPGVTTIYVTHDEAEGDLLSGRVMTLELGRIVGGI